MEQLWLLLIDLEEGNRVSIHRTREGAWRELLGFVGSSWSPDFADEDPPADEEERVRAYFELTDYRESYLLEYTPVED